MTADEEHEARNLFPVYHALSRYLRPGVDHLTTDPADLTGIIAWHGAVQTGCLIVAHCPWLTDQDASVVDRIHDAASLVEQVRLMCQHGERPRYLGEIAAHHQLRDVLGGPNDGC